MRTCRHLAINIHDLRNMLAGSFDDSEWAFLNEEPRFQTACEVLCTLSDFERVSELGQKILADRDFAFRKCAPIPNSDPSRRRAE